MKAVERDASYSGALCFSMQLTCFSIRTSLLHSKHYGKEGDGFFSKRFTHTEKEFYKEILHPSSLALPSPFPLLLLSWHLLALNFFLQSHRSWCHSVSQRAGASWNSLLKTFLCCISLHLQVGPLSSNYTFKSSPSPTLWIWPPT